MAWVDGAVSGMMQRMRRSLFDRIEVIDGRPLRKVWWEECAPLASRYERIASVFADDGRPAEWARRCRVRAAILMGIRNSGIPASPHTYVDDIVSERELTRILVKAARDNPSSQ